MGRYAPFISRKDAKGWIYPVFGMLRDVARRPIPFFRENAENAEKRCVALKGHHLLTRGVSPVMLCPGQNQALKGRYSRKGNGWLG